MSKVNVGSVLKVLILIYKAILSGKTVNVGGTQVTLPNQGHTIPKR